MYQAKNTTLNDVSIYAQPGMGIVGHLSENISLNRLKVVPKDSTRYCSSNTDATHFASCYGTLTFNDCDIAGQGDDATNVHVYYQSLISRTGTNVCTFAMAGSFDLHSQKPDFPRTGDTLAIVNSQSLQETGYISVAKVIGVDPQTMFVTIEFGGSLPADMSTSYLADISALPSLVFRNSRVKSHRARSLLCKTRNVLIDGNTFYGCTGTAIHLGAEGYWKEGVTSKDVVISNNTFIGVMSAGQMLVVGASRRVAAYGNMGMKDFSSNDGTPILPHLIAPAAVRPNFSSDHSGAPWIWRSYSITGRWVSGSRPVSKGMYLAPSNRISLICGLDRGCPSHPGSMPFHREEVKAVTEDNIEP
jgi:hypothetical protein